MGILQRILKKGKKVLSSISSEKREIRSEGDHGDGAKLFSFILQLSGAENPEHALNLMENNPGLIDESFLYYFEDPQQSKFTATLFNPEQKFQAIWQLGLEQYIKRLTHQWLVIERQHRAQFFYDHARFFTNPFTTTYLDLLHEEAPLELRETIQHARQDLSWLAGTIVLEQPETGALPALLNSCPALFAGDGAVSFYKEVAESTHPMRHKALFILQLLADEAFAKQTKKEETDALLEKLQEADRHQNIKQKRVAYEEALTLAEIEEPVNKAMIHFKLGSALMDDLSGSRTDSIEQAMRHFHEAGKWFTRDRSPFAWARVQNGLARCYGEYQKGYAPENLDRSIDYLQQALQVFDRTFHPYDWGYAINNLGAAYLRRTNGNSSENLHKAIGLLEDALNVLTKEFVPEGWALCMTNLGEAYSNNQLTDRIEVAKKALPLYEEVAQLYQRETHPYQWAMLQMRIGGALVNMSASAPSAYIESALEYLQDALNILRPDKYTSDWITLMRYMGDAFSKRVRGDAMVNQESAIKCYTDSFVMVTIHSAPFSWAMLHMQLALLHSKRIRGDKSQNMATALRHLREARTVIVETAYPEEWASAEHLEGMLQLGQRQPNLPEDWEKAILHFENSLKYRQADKNFHAWSHSMNSLAAAYIGRTTGDDPDNRRKGIQLYETVLQHLQKKHDPQAWCIIMADLGRAYTLLAQEQTSAHQEKAIACFRAVLEIQTPDTHPLECYKVAYMLGNLYYRRQNFDSAAQWFGLCFKCAENLRQQSVHDFYRSLIAMETSLLFEKLVSCEIQLNNIEKAAFYAMAGKARVFTDQLRGSSSISFTPPVRDQQALKMKSAIELIREEIDKITSSPEFLLTAGQFITDEKVSLSTVITKKRQQLAELIEELSLHFPDMTESTTTPLVTVQQLRSLSGTVNAPVLVDYYRHDKGWCAFILGNDTLRLVPLPDVDYTLLDKTFTVMAACEAHALAGKNPDELNDELLPLLVSLHNTFISPLNLSESKYAQCVISLSRELALMPINIAYNNTTRRFFAEEYALTFIPGLGAWFQLAQQRSTQYQVDKPRLLSVVYPGHSKRSYLRFAEEESKLLTTHYPYRPVSLMASQAMIQSVIDHCNERDLHVVHFACHGQFNGHSPEHSGLSLVDGILTAERVQSQIRLLNRPTVILSACQTAQASIRPGDQGIGLVHSFFAAGAGMVLASQWAVNDRSTLALFTFYFELRKEFPEPEALKRAMAAVRKSTGWNHPIFWAAFTLTGIPESGTDLNN